jgi:hypothetical protein
MIIYIEGGNENIHALKKLSNELYSKLYASRGISNFYYGFTPHTMGYEKHFCDITFEDRLDQGTLALQEFLEIVESRFKIIRVEAEGEAKERETIAQWEQSHEQKPLPKKVKVSLPIVIIRFPKRAGISEVYGRLWSSKDGSEDLIISNKYTKEGIEAAKAKYHLVTEEEYKKIYKEFGAPEKPESALD